MSNQSDARQTAWVAWDNAHRIDPNSKATKALRAELDAADAALNSAKNSSTNIFGR